LHFLLADWMAAIVWLLISAYYFIFFTDLSRLFDDTNCIAREEATVKRL
jgi:hypothetical protein